MRKRYHGRVKRGRKVGEYTTGTGGTVLKGQRAGWPQRLGAAQWVRPVRLAETPALRRPTDSSARFQTAAPGRRSAHWKFHNDRHQPRAGAATARRSSPPPRLPRNQTPQTPPPSRVPTRVRPPAPGTRRAPPARGPTPPD